VFDASAIASMGSLICFPEYFIDAPPTSRGVIGMLVLGVDSLIIPCAHCLQKAHPSVVSNVANVVLCPLCLSRCSKSVLGMLALALALFLFSFTICVN
jgi:hypothetical protein